MEARPLKPDHAAAARRLRDAIRDYAPGRSSSFPTGSQHQGSPELGKAIGAIDGQREIVLPDPATLVAMAGVRNDPDALSVHA